MLTNIVVCCNWDVPKGAFKESFCSRRIGSGAEITYIATDEAEDTSYRIAIAAYDGRVQMWIVDSQFEQKTIFSIQIVGTIPRALTVLLDSSQNLLVFSLEDGDMYDFL